MELKNLDPKNANITLGKKYKLKERLGKGSFGQIFRALVKGSDEQFAVKVEKKRALVNMLLSKEAKVLFDLSGSPGFPRLIAFGKEDTFHYMVLTLLGANLNTLLRECRGKFNLKTVLMIVDQLLTLIQALHERGYVHRDIKPNNFLIGRGSTEKNVFLIDFGLTQPYKDAQGKHIAFSNNKGLVGTARYASVNAHLGLELSRRDDLESIGYMLIYFLKGRLPWQSAKGATKQEKYKIIGDMKANLSVETLCKGLPKEFGIYLSTVKSLGFQETPNYKSLKILFRTLFVERGLEFDYCYSWIKYQTTDSRSVQSKNSKFDHEEAQITTDFILPKGEAYVSKGNKEDDKRRNDLFGIPKFGARARSNERPHAKKTGKAAKSQYFLDDSSSKILISGEDEIPVEIDPEILPSQKVQESVYNKLEFKRENPTIQDDWKVLDSSKEVFKKQRTSVSFVQTHTFESDSKKFSIFRSKTSKGKGMKYSEPPSSDGKTDQMTLVKLLCR